MKYSKLITDYATKYNISEIDVLFAVLIANGTPAAAAYHHTHRPDQTDEDTLNRDANNLRKNKPGINKLVLFLRAHKPGTTSNQEITEENINTNEKGKEKEKEERKKYTTVNGLVSSLIESLRGTEGKERAAILMQLAKLQESQLQQDENKETTVHYWLPFNSKCRNCELMKRAKV